jgi:hypothetical protein
LQFVASHSSAHRAPPMPRFSGSRRLHNIRESQNNSRWNIPGYLVTGQSEVGNQSQFTLLLPVSNRLLLKV